MQYRLIKKYLEVMTDEQTLVVMSGHPLGLFHSHKMAPRCIISNGLMVGMYDNQKDFNRAAAQGITRWSIQREKRRPAQTTQRNPSSPV